MAREVWKPGTLVYPLPAVLVTCSNGKEALDFMLNYPSKYDMILMDILIPVVQYALIQQ